MLIIPTMQRKALPQHNEDSKGIGIGIGIGGGGGRGAKAEPQTHSRGTDRLTQPQADLMAPNQINPH